MRDTGHALSVPVCGDNACHMGTVGVHRLLLRERSLVSAGVITVFSAAVFCLLLRGKLVEHALQVRVVRVDSRIHDADRAGRIGGRVLVPVPFLPSGNAETVPSCRRERRRINVRSVRQFPLHRTEVRKSGLFLLRLSRFFRRSVLGIRTRSDSSVLHCGILFLRRGLLLLRSGSLCFLGGIGQVVRLCRDHITVCIELLKELPGSPFGIADLPD